MKKDYSLVKQNIIKISFSLFIILLTVVLIKILFYIKPKVYTHNIAIQKKSGSLLGASTSYLVGKGIKEVFEEACGNIPGYPENPYSGFGHPPLSRRTITAEDVSFYKELGLKFVIIGGTGPAGWDNIAPVYPGIPIANSIIYQNLSNWNDPNYDFSELDKIVILLKDNNIEPVIAVAKPPRWAVIDAPPYEPNPNCVDITLGYNTSTKQPREVRYNSLVSNTFREFMMAIADRYNGTHIDLPLVKYFHIGNELNLPNNSAQNESAVAAAISWHNQVYDGIKSRNPNAEVWLAHLSPCGTCNNTTTDCLATDSRTPASWITMASKYNLKFDRFGYHPYLANDGYPPSQQPVVSGCFYPSTSIDQLRSFFISFPNYSVTDLIMTEGGIIDVFNDDQILASNTLELLNSLENSHIPSYTHFLLDWVPQAATGLIYRPKINAQSLFSYNGNIYELWNMDNHLWIRRIYSFSPLSIGSWNHFSMSSLTYPSEIINNKWGSLATQTLFNKNGVLTENITLGNKYWSRTLNLSVSGDTINLSPATTWYSNTLMSAWQNNSVKPYFTNIDSQGLYSVKVNSQLTNMEFVTAGKEYWLRVNSSWTGWGNFSRGLLKDYFNGTTSNDSNYPHPPDFGIDSHYMIQDGDIIREGFTAGDRYWSRTGSDFNNMGLSWWTGTIKTITPATTFDANCSPLDLSHPINRDCRKAIFNVYKNFSFSQPSLPPSPSLSPSPSPSKFPSPSPSLSPSPFLNPLCAANLLPPDNISQEDLAELLKHWAAIAAKVDIVTDNKVNILDLSWLVRGWGIKCN